MSQRTVALAILTLSGWCVPSVFAQTFYTFTNTTTNGDWFSSTSWSPQAIPGAPDSAGIDHGRSALLVNGTDTVLGLFVATQDPSNGQITIGASGSLAVTTSLSMGNSTGRATLDLINGGVLNSGAQSNFANAVVLVDGTGSLLHSAGTIVLGTNSPGTSTITVQNGGHIVGDANFQVGANSTVGAVVVTGSNSSITAAGGAYIGNNYVGSLSVLNGGFFSGSFMALGFSSTSSAGTVLVDGAGSTLVATTGLNIGLQGSGTLTVQNGGSGTSGGIQIGNTNSPGGTMIIDGSSSRWTAAGLTVNTSTNGVLNSFIVRNGAAFSSTGSILFGYSGGSAANASIDIAGPGSSFQGGTVGLYTGGTMTVENGATAVTGVVTAVYPTSAAIVTGSASWTNAGISVYGPDGLSITNGGTMTSTGDAWVDGNAGATSASVTISGPGSVWNTATNLNIYNSATITVSNGGTLTGNLVNLGYASTGSASVIDVSGPGSLLQAGTLSISSNATATPNILNITDGATVDADTLSISANQIVNLGTGGLGGSITGGTITGPAAATLNANFTDTGTIASALAGDVTVNKTNSGTLVLTGSNDTGGGTINDNGGAIRLSNDAALFGYDLALNGGSVLIDSSLTEVQIGSLSGTGGIALDNELGHAIRLVVGSYASDSTYGGVISGDGFLTKAGIYALTLTATNTYSGGTYIQEGVINFSSLANFGTGTISISGGGLQWASGNTTDITQASQFDHTLSVYSIFDTNGNDVTLAGALDGASPLEKDGLGNLTLSGSNSFTGRIGVYGGSLTAANDHALGNESNDLDLEYSFADSTFGKLDIAANVVNHGTISFYYAYINVELGDTFTALGNIDSTPGYTNIDKAGDGTMVFGGTDSNASQFYVEGGTFELASGGVIDSPSNLVVENSYSGSVTPALTLDEGSSLTVPEIDLNDNSIINIGHGAGMGIFAVDNIYSGGSGNAINVDIASTGTLSAQLIGTIDLLKLGSGTLVLDADNSQNNGITTIDGGAVRLDNQYAVVNSVVNINVDNGLQFGPGQTDVYVGALSGTGDFVLGTSDGSGVNLSLGSGDFTGTYGGVISGTGNIAMFGNEQAFTGSNTFLGSVQIRRGTLAVNSDAALGDASNGILLTGTDNSVGTLEITQDFSSTRSITFSAEDIAHKGGVISVDAGKTFTYGGVISGSIANLDTTGLGTVIFTGTDTVDAPIYAESGTLIIQDTGSISANYAEVGDGTSAATMIIQNGGQLHTDGGGQIANNSTGSTSISGTGSVWNINQAGLLTVGSSGSPTRRGYVTITNGGVLNALGGLTIDLGTVDVNGPGATLNAGVAGVDLISGTLTVENSGSLTTSSALTVGDSSGKGYVNVLTGGSITAASIGFGGSNASTGTFNQTGGSVVVSGGINFGKGTNTYHLLGGTLETKSLTKTAGSGVTATFDWGGGTLIADNGFTSALTATLASSSTDTIQVNSGNSGTWSGTLTGGGTLHKTGLGTFAISGSNNYTGGTQLDGGVISFSNSNALSSGTITVLSNSTLTPTASSLTLANKFALTSGATLSLAGTRNFTLSSTISGSGALEMDGTGIVTLSGTNTYSGGTQITNGGEINFASLANFGSGTITLNGGGLQWASGNTTDISSQLGAIGNNGGIFDTGANTVTLAGSLSGSSTINKLGTGTLALSGSNAFTGAYNAAQGILLIANSNAIVNASGLEIGGGALRFDSSISTVAAPLAIITSGTLSGSSALTFSHPTTVWNTTTLTVANTGTTTLGDILLSNGNASNTLTLYVSSAPVVVSGSINNGGTLADGLTKSGTGTLFLRGANGFTGAATLSAGTTQIGNADALGLGVIAFNGGSLQGDGQAYTLDNALSLTNSSVISGSSALTFTGTLTQTGNDTLSISNSGSTTFGAINLSSNSTGRTLTVNTTGGTTSIIGPIANGGVNAGSLTKTGTGTLVLSGSNTYGGATTLSAGVLVVGNNSAFGSSGLLLSGGAIQGDGTARTLGNTLFLNASSSISGSSDLTFTGSASQSANTILTIANTGNTTLGAIGLSTNSTGHTLTVDVSGGIASVTGIIANGGSGAGSLTKTNSGTLVLTAANTYTGTTTISGGLLQLGNGSTGGSVAGLINDNAALAFDHSDSFTDSGTINGTGSVSQIGIGMVTLSGSNGYSGGTTITSGTLAANNNHAVGTSTVTVQSGGTFLVDNGVTVANNISLAGGEYDRSITGDLANAVNATSNLSGGVATTATVLAGTTGATTIQTSFAASTGAINRDIALSDAYTFMGTGTNIFALQLSIAGTSPQAYLAWVDSSNQLVNAINGNTDPNNATHDQQDYLGSFAAFQLEYGSNLASYLGAWGVDVSGGNTAVWAVIDHNSDFAIASPEPSTWALLGLGGLALVIFRRRKMV